MAKSSIIEESKHARGRGFFKKLFSKKTLILIIIAAVLGGGGYYYYSTKNAKKTTVAVKKTAVVKKDNLQIAVDTTGKVVAKDGVELSFSNNDSSAEVEGVYVKEGQNVKKGDKIASIKTSSLEFELRNALASYQSALASYKTKVDGATDKEKDDSKNSIDQAKLGLQQAQISLTQSQLSLTQTQANGEKSIKSAENQVATALNNLNNSADQRTTNVNNGYTALVTTIKSININLVKSLGDADSILGVSDEGINDKFEKMLGVKNIGTYATAKTSYLKAQKSRDALNTAVLALDGNSSQADIEAAATKAGAALSTMDTLLYDTKSTLDASVVSADFSQNDLDSFKSKISSDRSEVTNNQSSLTNNIQTIVNAKKDQSNDQLTYQKALDDLESAKNDAKQNLATSQNNIANAESNIEGKKLSLSSAELSYKNLIAPISANDLAAAKAQLTQASISVDKAKYNIEQATLTSPIDGVVAALNYKKGDIVTDNTKSMATILNKDTLYIEVNVEESDISKVKVGQKAETTFDAIDGLTLNGEVSFISLTSSSSSNGIVTYLVRVVFDKSGHDEVREGMTADVKLITSEANNVLTVPVDAVRNVKDQASVEKEDGTYAPVVTGFTDGTKVEIKSGLNLGDKIIY